MAARLPERWRRALELASRLGYAARGAVYLTVGVLAMLAALDLTPSASGAHEAMALWARWTPGLLLVALLAGCLLAFSIWRGVQSVFDADRHGHSPRALAIRAGQAVSGLAYGALAVSALELLDGFEDIGEADESESARTAAAEILALPHGDGLLVTAGLGLVAVGVGNFIQGVGQDFAKHLDGSRALCRWAVPLARAGYIGRGLATLPLGLFLLRAGWQVRAAEARSWADALDAVEGQPFGSLIVVLIALGLIAFGLFGVVEARYRRIVPPRNLSPG